MRRNLLPLLSLLFLLGLISVTSCKKEQTGGKQFRASMEDCTDVRNAKTSLNGTALEWVAGDRVKIMGGSTQGIYTATPQSPATTALLTLAEGDGVGEGACIAYYPAEIYYQYNVVTLPAVQTSGDGSLQGFPMCSYSSTNELQFKNLCGVLKLNLQKANTTVAKIAITTNTEINGRFTVNGLFDNQPSLVYNTMGNTGTNTTTLECNQSINTAHDFYIYLPANDYTSLQITITTADGRICTKTANTTISVARSQYSTVTLGGDNLQFETPGMLPGQFSINANGDKVSFAQGNLQYQASSNTWRFADNQYDYIGADNVNISATYTGWIDLFGWGTGSNPTATTSGYPYSDYITFVDWGDNAIANGGDVANSAWRTLTEDEWYYIVRGRNDNRNKRGTGTVNGVHGAILLPDNFTLPASCPAFVRVTTGDNWPNHYTLAQWADMEAAGAIFLPAAGNRWRNQDGVTINRVNTAGAYWTATPNPNNSETNVQSYYVKIEGSSLSASGISDSEFGFAVRLARDNN